MEHFTTEMPQLRGEHKANLGAPLPLDKLEQSLMVLATGTAPDMEGLPVEFHKAFWTLIPLLARGA